MKKGRIYVNHNVLSSPIPIVIILKAMNVASDMEVSRLVGSERELVEAMTRSIAESISEGVFTPAQARAYIGGKMTKRNDYRPTSSYRRRGMYISAAKSRECRVHAFIIEYSP